MARSRAKGVVAVDSDMEVTTEARSIHRLDICSLVCDMLKLIHRHGKVFGLALHLHSRALDDGSVEMQRAQI